MKNATSPKAISATAISRHLLGTQVSTRRETARHERRQQVRDAEEARRHGHDLHYTSGSFQWNEALS